METLDLRAMGLVELDTTEASAVNGGFGWKKFFHEVGHVVVKAVVSYIKARYGHRDN